MNDTIEDDVRSAFARVADPVVPRPDPLGRLLARRRHRTWRRGLTAAAAAVVLAVGGGTLATVPTGGPSPAPTPDTNDINDSLVSKARVNEWTRRLIDGPTRGNLAGDRAAVEEAMLGFASDRHQIDPSLDRIKLLALAEVADNRIAVAAWYDDEYATVVLGRTPVGDRPGDPSGFGSLGGMAGGLLPFFFDSGGVYRSATTVEHVATIALTPAGCTLDSSDTTTIGADGTARRVWVSRGDHLIEPGDLGTLWWRVTCDGQVRYEGTRNYSQVQERRDPPAAAPARGSAVPALVDAAVGAWRGATRHLGGTAPQALWAGPAAGGRSTVVVAGPGRDGRVLVTALVEPPADFAGPGLDTDVRGFFQAGAVYYPGRQPYAGERGPMREPTMVIPTPFGTATAASTDLVAVRLPEWDAEPLLGGNILVVAPPSATTLLVNGTGSLPLTDGVGVLPAPAPLGAHTLTAVDAGGNVLATARYAEPDATGQFFGERVVENWE